MTKLIHFLEKANEMQKVSIICFLAVLLMLVGLQVSAQYTIGTPNNALGTITNDDFPAVSSIVRADANPTSAASIDFTVTFNVAVTGVNAADFALTVTGTATGTIATVTPVSTTVYTVTVTNTTPSGGLGTFRLDIIDDNSIVNSGQSLGGSGAQNYTTGAVYNIDHAPPSITSFTRKTPATANTNASSLTFLVTFSKDVTNVGTNDFVKNTTSTTAITTVTPVTASTYDVVVSGGDLASFNGTVGIDLVASPTIADLGGNALPAGEPTTDETYTLDNTAPSTTSFTRKTPTTQNTTATSVTFLATFSEAVANVDNGDFSVSGLTSATIVVTPVTTSTYDVVVSGGDIATFNGTVGLDFVATPTIADLGGNALPNTEPTTDETYILDNTAPSTTS
ncbi:MAG: hypothetical protein ACPGXL_01515, partial [Chitinophagales bacterium]